MSVQQKKEILLIFAALWSFLVLNLQNSGTRKCLQKVFEKVTETEVWHSAALSMDKQNMALQIKLILLQICHSKSLKKYYFAFSSFINNACELLCNRKISTAVLAISHPSEYLTSAFILHKMDYHVFIFLLPYHAINYYSSKI